MAPPAARPAIPEPHPPATSSAISQLVPVQGQQPVEFNHAISYVNRIKVGLKCSIILNGSNIFISPRQIPP